MGGAYVKKCLTSEKCSVHLYIIMCIRLCEKKQSLCIGGKKRKIPERMRVSFSV